MVIPLLLPAAVPEATARAANARLNAEEYRRGLVELDSLPTMVYVELTQNCNLTCHMCRSAGRYDAARNMSDVLFDQIAEALFPTATWVDLRGWGESTILRDFTAKLRRTVETGVKARLVTNGLLITEEQFELILGSDGVVAVSVDAASPDLFAQLGRGDLRRVMANVRTGSAVAARLRRGTVYLNTVVSSFNLHEIPGIVDMAAHAGVRRVVLSPIKTFEGHAARLDDEAAAIQRMLADATVRARTCGVTVQLGAALHPDHVVHGALPGVCASPWSHALIGFQGDLIFCDHLINRTEYSVGNVAGRRFEDVWNGERFQAVRRAHLAASASRRVGHGFSKCDWCYANRYMDAEPPPMPFESRREVSTARGGILTGGGRP